MTFSGLGIYARSLQGIGVKDSRFDFTCYQRRCTSLYMICLIALAGLFTLGGK